MGRGSGATDQQQEVGIERFKLAELLTVHERDPETLEAAKRADLAMVARDLTELSGIPQDHPDYLEIQRIVGNYEEVFDRVIERTLSDQSDAPR